MDSVKGVWYKWKELRQDLSPLFLHLDRAVPGDHHSFKKCPVAHKCQFFSGVLICAFIWAIFLCFGAPIVMGRAFSIHQGGATHVTVLWCYMQGRSQRGNNAMCLPAFQLLSPLSTSKLGHSCADSRLGSFVCILEPCGSLQRTLLWAREFLPQTQPPQVFTARGFEAFFSHVGTLSCTVCLTPQFLTVYLHANVGPPSPPVAALPRVLSTLAAHLHPSCQDECFFLNSLVA